MAPPPPRVLTIGGSDPSGGAGVEADLKVITAHACYAMTAITALTAQNTHGVAAIHLVPADFLQSSLDAVLSDVGVDVVKTGMLASAEFIETISSLLTSFNVDKIVVDPVMVSTSGSKLLPDSAIATLISKLLPITYILTPNIPEAIHLLREAGETILPITTREHLFDFAVALHRLGPRWVLLKGGHAPFTKAGKIALDESEKEVVVDTLCDGENVYFFESPWVGGSNKHGTGCALASAVASNLSLGLPPPEACKAACKYVSAAISSSFTLGTGNNVPINHLHSVYTLPFPPGRFIDYVLDHPDIRDLWKEFTHHEFLNRIGDGSLEVEKFGSWIIQDYFFLTQFARATSLAGYKSQNMEEISKTAAIIQGISRELTLHKHYFSTLSISPSTISSTPEAQATTAYTRFLLDLGASADLLTLRVAMAPCLIGYSTIADRLYEEGMTGGGKEGRYRRWVDTYREEWFRAAVRDGREALESLVEEMVGVGRVGQLVEVFGKAVKMEINFSEMGLKGC